MKHLEVNLKRTNVCEFFLMIIKKLNNYNMKLTSKSKIFIQFSLQNNLFIILFFIK